MWWSEFRVALRAVLEELPHESYLVLPEERADGQFVQFRASPVGLVAELSLPAPAPKKSPLRSFLAPPSEADRLREAQWADCWLRLEAAGWSVPLPRQLNWWRELEDAATTTQYDDLVAEIVRVLTEEFGLHEPQELRYLAWQEQPFRNLDLHSLQVPRLSNRDWAARQHG